MELTKEQVAVIKGALWAVGNDMEYGWDYDWFDSHDPDEREEFDDEETSSTTDTRNGHKLCDILRSLLKENGINIQEN